MMWSSILLHYCVFLCYLSWASAVAVSVISKDLKLCPPTASDPPAAGDLAPFFSIYFHTGCVLSGTLTHYSYWSWHQIEYVCTVCSSCIGTGFHVREKCILDEQKCLSMLCELTRHTQLPHNALCKTVQCQRVWARLKAVNMSLY